MGIAVEKKLGHVFSISEDGRFKITDINSMSVVTDIGPGKSGLKYMIYDTYRAIFIIADGDGYIYLYNALTVCIITINSCIASSRITKYYIKYIKILY